MLTTKRRHRYLLITLFAALTSITFAYNPYCPNTDIPWLEHLPIHGSILSMKLRQADPNTLPDFTPKTLQALPIVAEAHFGDPYNLTHLTHLDGTVITYTNTPDNYRATSTITHPNRRTTQTNITFRAYTEDGKPEEYYEDFTTPNQRFRRAYEVYYGGNDYTTTTIYDYLANGTSMRRQRHVNYYCTPRDKFIKTDDTDYSYFFHYELNGERLSPPYEEFDFRTLTIYNQPLGADIYLLRRPRTEWHTYILQRDHRGNPTIYIHTQLTQEFDEWVPLNPTLHHITYEYY